MFNKNSRYNGLERVTADDNGNPVQAVKLRRLPTTQGKSYMVNDGDQLDVISKQTYNDSTRYWHVADANTDLEANKLVKETGRIICVPDN